MQSSTSWFAHERSLRPQTVQCLERLLSELRRAEGDSFRRRFSSKAAQKAAYRFVETSSLTLSRMLEAPIEEVAHRIRSFDTRTTLVAHDTTSFDYTHLPATDDLGSLESVHTRGYLMHLSLAIEGGIPLGPLAVQCWTRPPSERTRGARRSRSFDSKESARWWKGIEAAEEAFATPGRLLHVGDREADIYLVFARANAARVRLLIRAKGDHGVEHPEARVLNDLVAHWPKLGEYEVDVPASGTRAARGARLEVRAGRVEMKEPHGGKDRCALWGVWAYETGGAAKQTLDWLLVTNDPIETLEQALECVRRYRQRWVIEEFFKVLKTGLKAESLQLKDATALQRAMGLLLLVATDVLRMRKLTVQKPGRPAREVFTDEEIRTMQRRCREQKRRFEIPDEPAAEWMIYRIGEMGGHSGTRAEGLPGWELLWSGWVRFRETIEMRKQVLASIGYRED